MIYNRRRKNRGSIVVEMTILMPVFLLCVFLYITAFLYYVEAAEQMYLASAALYQEYILTTDDAGADEVSIYKRGGTSVATVERSERYADVKVELRKDAGNPIQNLRRWQSIADAVDKRGDS
ncbi:MAG: hypothetical protein EGQ63_06995 [Clostridiales bacterium]|nr:hypothetical protein [Clostridiales bacterium]